MIAENRQFLDFGRFRIDPSSCELLREGERVPLTPRAFDTLAALADEAGQVVPKQRLLERVWPGVFVADATITQNIYTIRKAFEQFGDPDATYIETIPRRGYRFTAAVTRTPLPPSAVSDPTLGIRSLAVLPFVSIGPWDSDSLAGLGMADALITRLGGLRAIAVRPTSAIVPFADSPREALGAGRALGVDAVVEGRIQAAGDRKRVTVQLVRVRDAATVWADTFEDDAADAFAVQDRIAERVVGVLKHRLAGEAKAKRRDPGARNVEAHKAYVKGRFFWNTRSAAGLERAIEQFNLALRHDPDYVLAWSGLADSYSLLPLFGADSPHAAFPRARHAAERALEIDPERAESHTSLAYIHLFYDRDWRAARLAFERAIAFNSGYSTAHHWLAFLHSALADHEEAVACGMRALELDPLSLVINSDLGLLLYFARRPEEALAQFHVALELGPEFAYARFGAAMVCCQLERYEEAIAHSQRAVELSSGGGAMLAALGFAHAMSGNEGQAREVMGRLESLAPGQGASAERIALVACGLGETSRAIEALRRADQERSRFVIFLGEWPAFDRIRTEPAFVSLLQSVGLRGE